MRKDEYWNIELQILGQTLIRIKIILPLQNKKRTVIKADD